MDASIRPGETFADTVLRLRAEYDHLRAQSNLILPLGRYAPHVDALSVDGHRVESFWFEDASSPAGDQETEATTYKYVRLHDIPETLSGDILRLRQNLPDVTGHFEIEGNSVRPIDTVPAPPEYPPDDEDASDLIAGLPQISVDKKAHFTKRCKYRSEVINHLLCQGGSCANPPISPHLAQLLGRSSSGELVSKRLLPRYFVFSQISPSAGVYRGWILHLIDGLRALHSLGIVHRDIQTENVLFADDGETLLLSDLEGRWG